MAFPALAKTWQFNVNQPVALQSSGQNQAAASLFAIKTVMLSFSLHPWTVFYSANASGTAGTAGDGVDRWPSSALANINGNVGGSNHSWMVFQQTAIGGGPAAGLQLCIDCNNNWGVGNVQISIIVSWGAGFTGGTATARPTATDEVVLLSNGNFIAGNVATPLQIHAMMSSDGQCFRLQQWRGGNNQTAYWQIDKVQNPVTGWTQTIVAAAFGATSGYANSYANLQGTNYHALGGGATPQFACGPTYETFGGQGGGLCQATGIGTAPNTFDGSWPVFPMGIAANGASNAGRLGNIFDLWWSPSGLNDGDTFPVSATARSFVRLGNLIFPWTGDSTSPLLA